MTTKRLFTTISMFTMAFGLVWAQGPNGSGEYYKAADGKKGAALKTAMFNKIKIKNAGWTYSGLKEAYETTDTRSDGYLRDWYSNATYYTPGSNFSGGTSAEGQGYNREHLVPQSWFKEASPMKSDIFHVVPTDAKINNARGSDPLGEVDPDPNKYTTSKNGYSKWGTVKSGLIYDNNGNPVNSLPVFEPNDEVKGDIARAYFYMVTCYEDKISDWTSSGSSSYVFDGNTYPGLTQWCLEMMIRWSAIDPVDDIEIARNNEIAKKQNRNPFIDYPGLEEYIWGNKMDETFSYDKYEGLSTGKQPVTMSFSPTSVTATLGESFTAPTLSMSASGLTVTYSSSNTSVATVNASTGVVTLKAVGVTIITATFAGNDDYYANSTTYTLTVKKQGGDDPTPVETVIWEEDWTGASENVSVESINNSSAAYQGDGGRYCKIYNEERAGGTVPELLIPKNSRTINYFIATIALGNASGEMPLSFKCNKTISVTSTTSGVTVTAGSVSGNTYNYVVNVPSETTTLVLKFATTNDDNARIDDIKLVSVAEEPTTTPGDIVTDGNINWDDLKALVKILLGITPEGDNIDLDAADVNEDGKTNIADVTKLINLLLSK